MYFIHINKMSKPNNCIGHKRKPDNSFVEVENPYHVNACLPIFKYSSEIVQTVEDHQVVIVSGKTGCGKTTQIPKMIYNFNQAIRKPVSILVTQPRRVAALNISKRLSYELDCKVGELVGYHIGMEPVYNSQMTKIFIKTTGIFLEELIHNAEQMTYTHIILDEVHERDINIDLVLIMIKDLLKKRQNIKVILMSATIKTESFANYFADVTKDKKHPPIIEIKENLFKINEIYLDQIIHNYNMIEFKDIPEKQIANIFEFNLESPTLNDRLFDIAFRLIEIIHKDYNNCIERKSRISNILIFLPGIGEILQLRDYIVTHFEKVDEIEIHILHSYVSEEDTRLVWMKSNKRKIILATNIAESSITIPNTDNVIDFCLCKEINYNQQSNRESLELQWASRANCEQRAGRTGRTGEGQVFRLVFEYFYKKEMNEFSSPEILRNSLEKTILKLKIYNCGEPEDILSRALDCPKVKDINETIRHLQIAGALTLPNASSKSGNLTEWGRIFAELPIDIQYSKLIMIAYAFDMIEAGIVCAALLSNRKKIFKPSLKYRNDLYDTLRYFSFNSDCDIITAYLAFKQWEKKFGMRMTNNEFDTRLKYIDLNQNHYSNKKKYIQRRELERESRDWCDKHIIDHKVAKETLRNINDIKRRLNKFQIYQPKIDENNAMIFTAEELYKEETQLIFKIILCGAFYDKIFKANYTKMKLKILNKGIENYYEDGFDPVRTVVLRDLSNKIDEDICENEINNTIYPHKISRIKYQYKEFLVEFASVEDLKKFMFVTNYRRGGVDIFEPGKVDYIYDISYQSILSSSTIEIESESLNKIYIEKNPSDLLLSRFVTDDIYERNFRVYAKNVTKLPNYQMFDCLMLLIFAPQIQFKANDKENQYESFKIMGKRDFTVDLPYLISTRDIKLFNEIRNTLSLLFKLKRYYTMKEIEVENPDMFTIESEYNKLVKTLKEKMKELLSKKRFKVIIRQEFVELFNKIYSYKEKTIFSNQNIDIKSDTQPSDFMLSYLKEKNLQNTGDALPPLEPLDIKLDYRLFSESGEKELGEERTKYNNLKHKVSENIQTKLDIINQTSSELLCGRCDSYICSISNLKVVNLSHDSEIMFEIGGWVMSNIKTWDIDDPRVKEDPYYKENIKRGITPDQYAVCQAGLHVIGIKMGGVFYATSYSNLRVKFPMNIKKQFNEKIWGDNFKGHDKILTQQQEMREEYLKNNLDCDLCRFSTNEPSEFRKHVKSETHKLQMEDLFNTVF